MEFETQVVPRWKAAFLSKPSISTRKGISFGYEAPMENTSTLVLTAPSGRFVDIRFPISLIHQDRSEQISLDEHPSYWAFSGISETTFYDAKDELHPGFSHTAHTVFKHDIDSKGPGIVDEGDCFLLPNGDAMEIGLWHETKELYKEYWTEPHLLTGRGRLTKYPVIVAETVGETHSRGMVIRIGDFVQGIFITEAQSSSGSVLALRSRRVIDEDMDTEYNLNPKLRENEIRSNDQTDSRGEVWVMDPRTVAKATEVLPLAVLAEGRLHQEAEFEYGGNSWKVIEYARHA